MSVVRLTVRITNDDDVVHEYTRSTTNASAEGVGSLLDATLGWMQAYRGALNEAQWAADLRRTKGAVYLTPEEVARRLGP